MNPLSWAHDDEHVGHEHNKGALDLMHPWTMFWYVFGFGVSGLSPVERVDVPYPIEKFTDAQVRKGLFSLKILVH